MTDREVMQQALEALIDAANVLSAPMFADAADALRKALEQPEQRPWQGLTETDWEEIDNKKDTALDSFAQGAVWAADQLKDRNT